jgi:hypothetical protein
MYYSSSIESCVGCYKSVLAMLTCYDAATLVQNCVTQLQIATNDVDSAEDERGELEMWQVCTIRYHTLLIL